MVSFKLFAGTNVGLRDNNEDNFTVCPDLTQNEWVMPSDHQQVIPLGERGCLIVVADGMGGQNAGEVASAIAIDTVQTMFAPDCLTEKVLPKPSSIKEYLKKVISKADTNVKEYSKKYPEAEGLGSTIVMAWVVGNKVYIAWLGDSRAYAYVPNQGIKRLSKDHSYVQQLVDAGKITDVEAMNHPNSNVITRSLGDMSQKAKADVEEYSLEDGEIILLCSDGLCGVCPDEEIEGVIAEELEDLQKCKEHLSELALDNGGSDNITIALMQFWEAENGKREEEKPNKSYFKKLLLGVFGLFIIIIGVITWSSSFEKAPTPSNVQTVDTAKGNVGNKVSNSVVSRTKQQPKSEQEALKPPSQQKKTEKQQKVEANSKLGTTSKANLEQGLTEILGKDNNPGLTTQNENNDKNNKQ